MRVIVLGSAAGGGLPQWNCGCGNCQDARLSGTGRTQSSVALSADGARWVLLNASPDLRAQLAARPELWPRGARGTAISAVVCTDGEIDHTLGLLLLREAATRFPCTRPREWSRCSMENGRCCVSCPPTPASSRECCPRARQSHLGTGWGGSSALHAPPCRWRGARPATPVRRPRRRTTSRYGSRGKRPARRSPLVRGAGGGAAGGGPGGRGPAPLRPSGDRGDVRRRVTARGSKDRRDARLCSECRGGGRRGAVGGSWGRFAVV